MTTSGRQSLKSSTVLKFLIFFEHCKKNGRMDDFLIASDPVVFLPDFKGDWIEIQIHRADGKI